MRQIDMSAEAVTARLKLVSQLRELCLSLGTAKIKRPALGEPDEKKSGHGTKGPEQKQK